MKIPITKPYFDGTEIEEIKESLESGWLVQGPKVRQFEQKFSEFTAIQYPKAVSSCTTALHMGLLALGVKEGQDVIVPSFTFIATPNSVRYTGAEIAFCDIDINTYNLNPVEVERLINKNYKNEGNNLINKKTGNTLTTILTVHQFGLASNLPEINKIAEKYNLKVLEDGACAVGARINNTHVGNFGNIAAFSSTPENPSPPERVEWSPPTMKPKRSFSKPLDHTAPQSPTCNDIRKVDSSCLILTSLVITTA